MVHLRELLREESAMTKETMPVVLFEALIPWALKLSLMEAPLA